jgi:hypothetical protein
MRFKGSILLLASLVFPLNCLGNPALENTKDTGYRGIWFTLGQKGEYGDKYSGGLGTYTAKHRPLAVYSPEANKTFFTYGGTKEGERHLLIMASYFDHTTGKVPRPTIAHDKDGVTDPHDNGSICLDENGHVWIFVSGRGRKRPGFKYRSLEPYSVDSFERITEEEITYPQPWKVEGHGLFHMFTKYTQGRELYWNQSADGREWTEDRKLAGMGGHYQASYSDGKRVLTAFNMHPGGNVDKRTNLYFVQTDDQGATWKTVSGATVETPLTDPQSIALVRDFRAEGRLVYMKDLKLDREGNPVILIVTSSHHMPGPEGGPRTWTICHWNGAEWLFHEVTRSTHNYDMGFLSIEESGVWRVFGPTDPGPQRWGAGGEVAIWRSEDQGRSWTKEKQVTRNSEFNQTYVRDPLRAHPDFFAFWADGNPDEFSESRLYFTDREGSTVRRFPYRLQSDFESPETVVSE